MPAPVCYAVFHIKPPGGKKAPLSYFISCLITIVIVKLTDKSGGTSKEMKTEEWHLCICLDLFLWVPLYFEAVSSSYGQGTVFGPNPAMW